VPGRWRPACLALVDVLREYAGGTEENASAWLTDLHAQGRFVEDIWGG
jgi:sulfite reductase alpha subunit-like flavoprotein